MMIRLKEKIRMPVKVTKREFKRVISILEEKTVIYRSQKGSVVNVYVNDKLFAEELIGSHGMVNIFVEY